MAANNKKMEITIELKDQFTKGIESMGTSFKKVIEEIKDLNKAVFKANEMTVEGLEKMNKGFKKTEKVLTKTKKATYGLGKATTSLREGMGRLRNTVFSLQTAFLGLGAGFIIKSFINAASSAEGFKIRLDTLLGSQEDSAQAFKNTAEYAATVSHQFEELLQSTTTLGGVMHEGSDQIQKWLPLIGDLAAVSGLTIQETTSNFIRMYSAGAAAADLFRERGILALLGITAKTQYTVEQTRKILIEAWEDPASKFRDAAQELARTWKGLLSMMADRWFLFRLDVMEGGDIFGNLKAALALLVDKIDEMKASGELNKWAKEMSEKVTEYFWKMAFGVASIYDTMAPIVKNFAKLFSGIWDWFKGLPTWVQTAGLVLAIVGGSNVKLTLAAFALIGEGVKDMVLRFKLMKSQFSGDSSAIGNLRNRLVELQMTLRELKNNPLSIFKSDEEQAKQARQIKYTEQMIGMIKTRILELEPVKIIDSEEIKKDADTAVTVVGRAQAAIAKKWAEMIGAGKKAPRPKLTPDTEAPWMKQAEAALKRLQASSLTYLMELDKADEEGFKTFGTYWSERRAKIEEVYLAELALIQQKIDLEPDPTKKLALETAYYTKIEEFKRAEIELTKEHERAEVDLNTKKIEFVQKLKELHARATDDGSMAAKYEAEIIALDERLRAEMELIYAESALITNEKERMAVLDQVDKDQELERAKLLVAQQKALWDKRLDFASESAGHLKDIFTDLYEIGGEKSKKMFNLMKKVAIAESLINTAKAVTGALGTPPYGLSAIATAALIAIKGGVEVAKIKAQEMAEGGEVQGYSPHSKADNIPIRGTAGEFMQPVAAVKHYGKKTMEGIRQLAFPKELFQGFSLPTLAYARPSNQLALGGPVIGSQRADYSVSVPINISSERMASIAGALQNEVEETVIRVMERELR